MEAGEGPPGEEGRQQSTRPQGRQEAAGPGPPDRGRSLMETGEGRAGPQFQGARGQAVPALPHVGATLAISGIPARVSIWHPPEMPGGSEGARAALPTQPPPSIPSPQSPLPAPTPQPAWRPGLEGQVGIIRRPWPGRGRCAGTRALLGWQATAGWPPMLYGPDLLGHTSVVQALQTLREQSWPVRVQEQ